MFLSLLGMLKLPSGNFIFAHTQRATVVLSYSILYGVRTTDIYIYEKFTIQLTSLTLAPNL